MREYPTIPNVFRVGSASSLNILDANNATATVAMATSSRSDSHKNATILSTDNLRYHNVISKPAIIDDKRQSHMNNKTAGVINSISGGISNGNASADNFESLPEKHCHPSGNAATSMAASSTSLGSVNSFTEITSFPHTNTNRSYTNERSGGYFLWIMTPVAASVSVAIVIAALAGPQWLYTEEKLPNSNYNGTANFNAKDDGAYITKYTKSSLWILCSALQGMESSYNCIKIDYFPKEGYQLDPLDSTSAIPYTVTKSCPFFLASGAVLLISFIVFLVPTCSQQSNLYYFTSGIMFIVSGLFMLIGLIAYISILKAAIGSKLRPRSTLQPAMFKVTYGQSFFLFVFGFISTEFVGVLNIFMYISLQQVGHYKKISCLSFMNMPEKIKELENEKQFHRRDREKDDRNRYMCQKHPIPSNFFFANDYERRYYFEKAEKCDLHSKNLAKSLNELYTEPAPTFSTFETPQQDIPMTRSVSTTTELFANNNGTINGNGKTKGKRHGNSGEDDDMDDDDRGSSNRLQDICGLTRGIRKTKDELFNEFCKRAGMRPKPKDIYYIEDNDDAQGDENIYIVDNGNLVPLPQSHPLHPNHRNYHHHHQAAIKSQHQPPTTTTKQGPHAPHHAAAHRRNSATNRDAIATAQETARKRNSNLSLHTTAAAAVGGGNGGGGCKMYPKSFFDLERCESEIWNNYPEQYFMKKDYNLYHSRTLPKSFMKRNYDSQDSVSGGTMATMAMDGAQRGGGALMHHSSSRDAIHHSGRTLHKSCEDINSASAFVMAGGGGHRKSNNNIYTSPMPAIRWPTAIPASPSSFSAKSFRYPRPGVAVAAPTQPTAQPSQSQGHHKFARGYAFDDHRRPGDVGFDLDEMERERRKSHSSLFEAGYDMINGTAV